MMYVGPKVVRKNIKCKRGMRKRHRKCHWWCRWGRLHFSRRLVQNVYPQQHPQVSAVIINNWYQTTICPRHAVRCMYYPHRHGRRHLRSWEGHAPHFCGMYPAGGTTQFTLYTCGVLQPAAKVTQFAFGFFISTWKFCFLFLYSLLLAIQSRKLGSWILHCWRTR